MEKNATIAVESANELAQSYYPPIQSADTLFHFVRKFDYILSVIKEFAVIPRYCVEDVDYLDIDMKQIAYPMLCFCDINLHKIQDHMNLYGSYGIAFSKKWGIEKGIQPIQYVNTKSPLKNDFSEAFMDAVKSENESKAADYLLSQMYYLKAIQGTMERDGQKIIKNFTDECEWRFIPDVKGLNLPQAVAETEIFNVYTLNNALKVDKKCWLQFGAVDVKYIILNSYDEFDSIVEVIKHKGLETTLVDRLISRIVVWQDVKGDF